MLYRLAHTKGDAMMSRVPKDKQDRVKEKLPLPTKLFVLVAGVVRMDWRRYSPDALSVSWEKRTSR